MLRRNRQKGFTLIELLIVVAIIGIIAAILIPNLLDALQKAKQKRTMSDIRNLGTAWMAWLTDQVGAASAGSQNKFDASLHSVDLSYATLVTYLRPTSTFFYMQEIPQFDGWGNDLDYAMNSDILGASVMSIYAMCRGGAYVDGAPNKTDIVVGTFLSTDYDQDIVWADGYFVRWPEGGRN